MLLDSNNYFKLPESKKYIILGNSHPEHAFNDSIINSLQNLGKSGQSYYYNYLISKRIIPKNKENLKTVFIEFGTKNIDQSMDQWTWGDSRINQYFPRYFSLMSKTDFNLLWDHNSQSILNCTPKSFIKEIGYTYFSAIMSEKKFISNTRFGGYQFTRRQKADSLAKVGFNVLKREETKKVEVSRTNLNYLKDIITLCEQNKVEVVLLRTPVHKNYATQGEEDKFQEILKKEFSDIPFIDLAHFPLPNEHYADYGHLNYKGAIKFSLWFEEALRKNNVQDYYLELDEIQK